MSRVAIVTGGTRGIGEAIARTLAAHGAQLILASRKIDDLKRVEEDIAREGGKAFSVACHTGEMGQIRLLFEKIRNRSRRLDILL